MAVKKKRRVRVGDSSLRGVAQNYAEQILNAQLNPFKKQAAQIAEEGGLSQRYLGNLGKAYQNKIRGELGSEPTSAKSQVGRLLATAAGEQTSSADEAGRRQKVLRGVLGSDVMTGPEDRYQRASEASSAAQRIGAFGLQGQAQLDWLKRAGAIGAATTAQNRAASKRDTTRNLQQLAIQKSQLRGQLPALVQDVLQRERQWWLDKQNLDLARKGFGLNKEQAAFNNALALGGAGGKASKEIQDAMTRVQGKWFPNGLGTGAQSATGKDEQGNAIYAAASKPFRNVFGDLRAIPGITLSQAALTAARWVYGSGGPAKIKHPKKAYQLYLKLGIPEKAAAKITYDYAGYNPFNLQKPKPKPPKGATNWTNVPWYLKDLFGNPVSGQSSGGGQTPLDMIGLFG